MTREQAICREATMKIEGGRMSEKRYPTRMHEVLGVEPDKEYTFENGVTQFNFYVDTKGHAFNADKSEGDYLCEYYLTKLINHPEHIVRNTRLTKGQVRVLEALYEVFDFKWIAKQKDGRVMAYANRPNKSDDWYGFWFSGEGDDEEDYGWMVKTSSPVCSLISWSDPAPLDIVQVLRKNGVEVEG